MHALLQSFLIFAKIGAFSFGGGYAMLPFIEREIVDIHKFLSKRQFIDVLGISQVTPGPIAINSATFIGFMYHGVWGAMVCTLGMVFGPFIYMNIVGGFLEAFKNTKVVSSILLHLRPVTCSLILCAFLSTFTDSILSAADFGLFVLIFLLLYFKKLSAFAAIGIFGGLGILAEFVL